MGVGATRRSGCLGGYLPSCKAKNFPSTTHTPAQLRSGRTRSSPPDTVPEIVPTRGQKDLIRANESQGLFHGKCAEVLEKKRSGVVVHSVFLNLVPQVRVLPGPPEISQSSRT